MRFSARPVYTRREYINVTNYDNNKYKKMKE